MDKLPFRKKKDLGSDAEWVKNLEQGRKDVIELIENEGKQLRHHQRPYLYNEIEHDMRAGNQGMVRRVHQLIKEVKRLVEDLGQAKEQIGQLKGQINDRQDDIKTRELQLENAQSEYDTLVAKYNSMIDNHQQNIDDLKKENEKSMGNLTKGYELEIARCKSENARLVRQHEKAIQDSETEHRSETARLDRQHKRELDERSKEYKRKEEKLLRDADSYSTTLLARDDFKPTSDANIKARFLDFARDVEALAKVDWRDGNQQLATRLKRYILRDSIWASFHELVFCSPFRIFGEEGRSLEKQWNEQCGRDSRQNNGHYTWPPPAMATERWRYVTVTEGYTALRKPLPSEYDPRAKLKVGFVSSMEHLKQNLASILEEVADPTDDKLQEIHDLAYKAANLWFEFAMQRCRVLILMNRTNLASIAERVSAAQEGSVTLLVTPALQRLGNSKGLSLDDDPVTIGGCVGEIKEVFDGIVVENE